MGKVLLGNAACMNGADVPHFPVRKSKKTSVSGAVAGQWWCSDGAVIVQWRCSGGAVMVQL